MKKHLIFFVCVFFSINNYPFADEIETIDQLIETSSRQLEKQRELKELMISYKHQCDLFEKGNESKVHIFRLVATASQLLTKIAENHLQHLFAPEYMEELSLFSSILAKRSPSGT
jgi:hypothetical protein